MHATSRAHPVDSTLALRAAHGFKTDDVASIAIAGTERMLRVNNIPAPKDVMMAQYSIPFCVALALYRNPVDPRSFDDSAARDPQILGLASRVRMSVAPPPDNRADLTTTVTIALKDGRSFTRRATDFMGTPERPLGARRIAREIPADRRRAPRRRDGARLRPSAESRERERSRLDRSVTLRRHLERFV